MSHTFKPILPYFGYINNNGYTFTLPDGKLELVLDNQEELKTFEKLFSLIDGHKSIDDLSLESNISKNKIKKVLEDLQRCGVIVDSRELSLNFHKLTNYEAPFSQEISVEEICDLQSDMVKINISKSISQLKNEPEAKSKSLYYCINNRSSCRNFELTCLPKEQILELYKSLVYSNGKRTSPSAGGIYPLSYYLISKIKDKNFPNIIYEFVPQRCGFVEVKNNLIEAQLEGAFGGKVETKDYPYYCVITLNLKQNIQKYSNRGYNFSMIEVGHNCQNFLLKAVDLGLGALEYANFNTNLLTSILGLNENKSPIISIVFGAKDKLNNKKVLNQNNLANNLSFLKLKTVGEDKITPWVETTLSKTQEYYSGYYTSICDITIKQGNKKYIDGAFGYSTNRLESTIKCLAEAYERYSSTEYKLQNYSKAVDLDAQYLNPNLIYPLHNEFYNNNPIYQKFDPDSQRYFVKGKFLTSNKTVYVPIELIYFPVSNKVLGYKKHIFGNSTGTACHFDEQLALQSCILECIERDAFATSWYSGSGISQILDDDLPNWLIQKKIEWQKLGYKVYILNITKDSLPVVLSIIYSKDQFPALGTGCACRLTFEESIESAFLECEQGFMNWINSKHKIPNDIEPQNISRAWHHPALYSQGQNIEYLKPFLESKFESIANIYNLQTLESVISKFNFARFDLKIPSNKEDLWVIKVISPTLMPLNFGFGNEPFLHSRLNELNLAWSKPYPAFPHFFP